MLFASLLLCAACFRLYEGGERRNHAIKALMDSAEVVMNDNPQKALEYMEIIDAKSLSSKSKKARYALLYTEAQYKNYIPIPSDSLIKVAVQYYSISRNTLNKFKSYYYLGAVYNDLQVYPDALLALTHAEQLVDKIDDYYLRGLLYNMLGTVYKHTYDYNFALKDFELAEDLYKCAGKELHWAFATYDIAECLHLQHYYSATDSVLRIVQDWADKHNEYRMLSDCLFFRLACSFYMNTAENSKALLDSCKSYYRESDDGSYSLILASYFIAVDDYDKAFYYLNKVQEDKLSRLNNINTDYLKSLLYEKLGQSDKAFEYYKNYVVKQNSDVLLKIRRPVVGIQKDYYQNLVQLESIKSRNRITIMVLVIVIMIVIVVFLWLYIRFRQREYDAKVNGYLQTIDELTACESKNRDKISCLNLKVREMLRKHFIPSDYLYTRFYEQIDDNKKAERLYKVVKAQMDAFTSSKNIDQLDGLLNETFDGIMDKLETQELDLKEKEIMLIRFVLTGFSAKSIAALLNDTQQNINQRKKRLLDKIAQKSPVLMEELSLVLSPK